MNNIPLHICNNCDHKVVNYIECSLCYLKYHRRCAELKNNKLKEKTNESYWVCLNCKDIFPFQNVSDEELNHINFNSESIKNIIEITNECTELNFKTFEIPIHRQNDFENKIDPDFNFYSTDVKKLLSCNYYSDCQFTAKIDKYHDGLSFIHFNARSLGANFINITEYLTDLNHSFDIIAISETWLNTGTNFSLHNIKGYDLFYVTRNNKKGGGVAIYTQKRINCKVLEQQTLVIDNMFECITIELCIDKQKNVIVSCLYRAPGDYLEQFNEHLDNLLKSFKKGKTVFICGDFNIDLLKYETHNGTRAFTDIMFSYGMYPLIDKPSRITEYSHSLIDNIFTNEPEHNEFAGLLINDISDHLPIFAITKCNIKVDTKEDIKFNFVRNLDNEAVRSFKNDLSEQTWEHVYNSGDVNSAYENFLSVFNKLYDKNCPMRKYCIKDKIHGDKPWITLGLRNACRKKNNLYKHFLRNRTTEAENRYKVYKNKLGSILKSSKKKYFHNLLEKQKNNMKET